MNKGIILICITYLVGLSILGYGGYALAGFVSSFTGIDRIFVDIFIGILFISYVIFSARLLIKQIKELKIINLLRQ